MSILDLVEAAHPSATKVWIAAKYNTHLELERRALAVRHFPNTSLYECYDIHTRNDKTLRVVGSINSEDWVRNFINRLRKNGYCVGAIKRSWVKDKVDY